MNKNKTSIAIALLLMLTIATLMAGISFVSATGIETKAQMIVGANPIGVGQQTLVVFGVSMPPPGALLENDIRWENLTVTITKPDGSIETRYPLRSDTTGLNFFMYTPTATGKYYFQCSFPGQTIAGVYYKPSTSRKVELTVQEEPIPSYPSIPLPNEYWTRPIYSMNRAGTPAISGNWLGFGRRLPWSR